MFCPSCGQEQITGDTRFCSRCGLLMTGVAEILRNGGALPQALTGERKKKKFYQKRGFKQGVFMFFLAAVIVPIIIGITVVTRAEPAFGIILTVILAGTALLRMIYSILFEEAGYVLEDAEQQNFFGGAKTANALPPPQSIPVTDYAPPRQGNWRETNDLAQPSVTEGTTKLFEKENDL